MAYSMGRTELARRTDSDEQFVAESRPFALDALDNQHAAYIRAPAVAIDHSYDLSTDGVVVLADEGDALRLGLVHDVG